MDILKHNIVKDTLLNRFLPPLLTPTLRSLSQVRRFHESSPMALLPQTRPKRY